MKTFARFTKLTPIVLLSALFFNSCTKQVAEEVTTEKSTSIFTNTSGCKPVVFGVFSEQHAGGSGWETSMQKWYGNNGKVAYIKATLHWSTVFGGPEPVVPFAEVTYHNNNQVYVRNVLTNDTVMRVTLDAQQRPAASYFRHDRLPDARLIDTSYYHFTGDRLDSIIRFMLPFFSLDRIAFHKLKFFYDVYGNLTKVELHSPLDIPRSMYFTYDYSKPVTGMLASAQIDRPYTLLQYLDILQFPVHHQIINASRDGNAVFFFTDIFSEYSDYHVLGNGLVQSYKNVGHFVTHTYYTGWQCDATPTADAANRKRTDINSLDDFRRLFPQAVSKH